VTTDRRTYGTVRRGHPPRATAFAQTAGFWPVYARFTAELTPINDAQGRDD
jgi:hypothetical protein